MVLNQPARGFSLVELLISVGILGLLMSVSYVNVRQYEQRRRDAAAVGSEQQALQLVQELQQLQLRALVGEQVDRSAPAPEQFILTTTATGYTLTTDQGTLIGQRQWPTLLVSPVGCVIEYSRQQANATFDNCVYDNQLQTTALITLQAGSDGAWRVKVDGASGLAAAEPN